jgi:hypothetical protein
MRKRRVIKRKAVRGRAYEYRQGTENTKNALHDALPLFFGFCFASFSVGFTLSTSAARILTKT